MGKKSSATAVSKISSSSALATSSSSSSWNKSSILKSSFAPSYLQLHLFASVIQSFESQQLRIHDTSNGKLKQQYSTPSATNITCLDWGFYGPAYREQRSSNKKKRKRSHDNHEDVVVAFGTSKADIFMYSPTEGKIVGVLKGGHQREIKDFKFVESDNLDAWSIGSDGKLVQWDLRKDQALRTISLPDPSIQTLCTPSTLSPQILCASFAPFAVTFESKDDFRIESFDAFKNPVQTIIRSANDSKTQNRTFLAADHDRYVNLYDCSSKKIVRTLVASGGVARAGLCSSIDVPEDELLAVVTADGVIDLFWKPFALPQSVNGDIRSQRKALTRKADATVKLVSPDQSKKQVPVFSACLSGSDIVIASVDGGVEPAFQKLRWQDEGSGELLFGGVKEVQKVRLASTFNTATMNGAKDMGQTHVNEARTVVTNGIAAPGSQAAAIEISSSEDEEEEAEADRGEEDTAEDDQAEIEMASAADSDADMEDAESDEDEKVIQADAGDAEEPSFGDLLAQRHPEAISIMDTLPTDQNAVVKVPESNQAMLPSGMSLGTVLTQSLRTNDQSLLETCLHVTDENIIQNTILRLDSALAANLLTKLAERLADRPGRYGHLLTWVQSTMIAHGGAIAGQAGVASKLRTLYQVLNERSRILPSILLLKGKLDMMNAQQTFRAQAEAHRRGIVDAPSAVYIEGEEDNWSSDEDHDEAPVAQKAVKSKKGAKRDLDDLVDGPETSEDEGMPLVNGAYVSEGNDDDDLDDFHHPRTNGILDDEAEVSGEDEEDESGKEETEEEEGDEDEEDSEMDDFINDGEISEVENEDDMALDEADAFPQPAKKKSKHR